jgi:hypothetical protein
VVQASAIEGNRSPAGVLVFLCGPCEYAIEHPDAKPATLPPRERRAKRLQRETLFDCL